MRTEPFEHTGKTMIARDPWYGSYIVEVIGIRVVPNGRRIDVTVLECVVPPSDRAILNPDARYHREPYEPGSRQNFAPDCLYCLPAAWQRTA